jgi:hypothetical protein
VTGGALLNRQVYMIATDAVSLNAATGTSGYALFNLGAMTGDAPVELSFVGNPKGNTPIIGEIGTITGDFAGEASEANSEFGTLRLVAVPEPSAALLGAIGALGLLRRRRI